MDVLGETASDVITELTDLRGVPLGGLRTLDDGSLPNALRRIVPNARNAERVPVALFNSCI